MGQRWRKGSMVRNGSGRRRDGHDTCDSRIANSVARSNSWLRLQSEYTDLSNVAIRVGYPDITHFQVLGNFVVKVDGSCTR